MVRRPVKVSSFAIASSPTRPGRSPGARVSGNLPFVLLAEQFGHQCFERQAENSVRTIAEELFRVRVHANDLALAIHNAPLVLRRSDRLGESEEVTAGILDAEFAHAV